MWIDPNPPCCPPHSCCRQANAAACYYSTPEIADETDQAGPYCLKVYVSWRLLFRYVLIQVFWQVSPKNLCISCNSTFYEGSRCRTRLLSNLTWDENDLSCIGYGYVERKSFIALCLFPFRVHRLKEYTLWICLNLIGESKFLPVLRRYLHWNCSACHVETTGRSTYELIQKSLYQLYLPICSCVRI